MRLMDQWNEKPTGQRPNLVNLNCLTIQILPESLTLNRRFKFKQVVSGSATQLKFIKFGLRQIYRMMKTHQSAVYKHEPANLRPYIRIR